MSRIRSVSTAGRKPAGVVGLVGVRGQQPGRAQVPVGGGVEGEAEGLRRGQRHRHAVRHHRVVGGVALGPEVAHPAGDRVGVGVRDVHAGVAEAQPGEGGGQRHRPRGPRRSSPSRTARRKAPASSDSAFSDHMSATGLDPQ